jgi:prepilin-type N-terminal cleavage/methylation domain-containing protein
MKNNIFKKNNGFTLIELMVSITIFSMITLTAMGSFLVTLNAARQARALRFAMDNVNFAMESMSRSIRMGTNYDCASSWAAEYSAGNCSGSFIKFTPQDSPNPSYKIGYQLYNGTLNRYENSSTPVPIVSPDVNIDELNFNIKGAIPNDGTQASVYIIMKGTVMVKGVPQSFSLQTLASQRNF